MKVRRSRENIRKGLLVWLIFPLTIYAPIELSRVIINWGLAPEFIFGLVFMWLFYVLALLIISIIVQEHIKQKSGNKERNNND